MEVQFYPSIFMTQLCRSAEKPGLISGHKDLNFDALVFPAGAILAWGAVRFLSGTCLELRDISYARISSHMERSVALETFMHLQSLSLRFHLQRETGSVLRSVSRGAQSFSQLIRVVLFQIAPVLGQVLVVCIYMLSRFSWYFAVLTFCTIVSYFVFTFVTTEWRNKFRRLMNQYDNDQNQKSVDALLNFETVKYFCAEEHERRRYGDALNLYMEASIKSQNSLSLLNIGQSLVISIGMLGAMWLSARQVIDGTMTVGDWVLIQAFILQLYQPLGFLGVYYRMIKQNMVDVESMFALLNTPRDVTDAEGAGQLVVTRGEIKFDRVTFTYDQAAAAVNNTAQAGAGAGDAAAAAPADKASLAARARGSRKILDNVSFSVLPGQRVAIVGESGAGKSTIARLLYRFFDVQGGRITIDGQDVRSVTQESLRKHIGIVPQDCVLFNDTIGYNIGFGIYGRGERDATQDEIEAAARRAAIHGFIVSQKEQYDTKVGERGLRLSGGEKQRVAIARAILKSPQIMVFDEATSSLDTHTENEIQSALLDVSTGRSSLTIAHRLSTIMHSDAILVLAAGKIVERGTHEQLLRLGGVYKAMWEKQERTASLQASLHELQSEHPGQPAEAVEVKAHAGAAASLGAVTIDIGTGTGLGLNQPLSSLSSTASLANDEPLEISITGSGADVGEEAADDDQPLLASSNSSEE